MVKRDELSGWIGSMEKYGGKGGEAPTAPSGSKPMTAGPTRRPHLTRRTPHRKYQRQYPRRDPTGTARRDARAYLRRPAATIPAGHDGTVEAPIDEPWSQENDEFETMIRKLLRAEPASLIFADEALPVMGAIREHRHELMKVSGPLAKGFQSFVGKLDGVAANLTLILHLIPDPRESATPGVEGNGRGRAPPRPRFHPAARLRVLPLVGSVGSNTMVSIASWILTSQTTRVTSRELMRNVWDLRKSDLKTIQENLGPLIAGGWLEPKTTGRTARHGGEASRRPPARAPQTG